MPVLHNALQGAGAWGVGWGWRLAGGKANVVHQCVLSRVPLLATPYRHWINS